MNLMTGELEHSSILKSCNYPNYMIPENGPYKILAPENVLFTNIHLCLLYKNWYNISIKKIKNRHGNTLSRFNFFYLGTFKYIEKYTKPQRWHEVFFFFLNLLIMFIFYFFKVLTEYSKVNQLILKLIFVNFCSHICTIPN